MSKYNACPNEGGDSMGETFKHIALKGIPPPEPIVIPLVPPKHHLELLLRIPPYPENQPLGTPIQMVINLERPLGVPVCDTPGLTLFTTHGQDMENYMECHMMGRHTCDFICTCHKRPGASCMLYLRFERPANGQWDIPDKIYGIRHSWLKN